jgi:hypothetical protein
MNLAFYDHRHGYIYIVKNAKSRKEARKTLNEKLVGKYFEDIEGVEEFVQEAEKLIEL